MSKNTPPSPPPPHSPPPGSLRSGENPDVLMMVCTAGHVDHGKTRLVGMLTGCETDRLREEKERGLTIELGFAPCRLDGDLSLGIVDVPGHEKFVKNMVAGVSGIAMAILVIAADDGVMPQTVEHLQIMELLGVRRGMVAVTKIDLVDEGVLSRRLEEIGRFLEGTFLADGPRVCVSSETGQGFSEFYDTLVAQARACAGARRDGLFRMPVERVFLQHGYGEVISGIPVDGAVALGDTVELTPGGHVGRVRGIQKFGRPAQRGGVGQCLALNVPEFGKLRPRRGQTLCAPPGWLAPSRMFHLTAQTVATLDRALTNGEQIKFHTGAAEASGKIYLLEGPALGPGQRGLATVVLNDPLAAAPHDRFILRRPSPAGTVAGGEVLEAVAGDKRPRKGVALQRLRLLRDTLGDADPFSADGIARRVAFALTADLPQGASPDRLSRQTLLAPGQVVQALARLVDRGEAIAIAPDHYLLTAQRDRLFAEGARATAALLEREKAAGVPLSRLRQEISLPPTLWKPFLDALAAGGAFAITAERLTLRPSDRPAGADDPDAKRRQDLLDLLRRKGFETPRPDELPALLGLAPEVCRKTLQSLCDQGEALFLTANVVLAADRFKQAQDLVVDHIQRHGPLATATFKDQLGVSRKYALAILEKLDARRVTMRLGADRKLTPDYHKYLL